MTPQLQNYIAGEWVSGATMSKDVNPSDTNDVVAEYAQADKAQAERAVEAARAAFRGERSSSCSRCRARRRRCVHARTR